MRVFYFLIMLVGVMFVLNAAGMELPSGGLVSSFGDLQNFKSNDFYIEIIAIFALAATAGIIIGALTRTTPENYLIAALATLVTGFAVADMIAVYTQLNSYGVTWISWGVSAIMTILIFGFVFSMVDWWRGND